MQVKHSVVLVSYFIAGLGGKPDALNHFFLILNVKHHYPWTYTCCRPGRSLRHKPGDLWWSNDRCEHVFGLSRCSYGPFILAPVLGGGRLRQAEGEGGTFAGRQDGELAGVDGRWRRLGEGHFWASLLALVFHCYLLSSIRRSSLRCSLAGVQEVLKRQR